MNLRALTIGGIVALALPHTVAACSQLSAHIWMCDRDTPWEVAGWDAAGDGSTRILGDMVLNFTEEWPGYEIADDLATLEERYATYSEWIAADGNTPLEVFQSDRVNFAGGTAVRALQRDALDGDELMSAVMLAEVGASRIMLYLDTPSDTALADVDSQSRSILEMLNDTCADAISCADDYQRPGAATNERG